MLNLYIVFPSRVTSYSITVSPLLALSHNCFKFGLFRKHIKIIDKIWRLSVTNLLLPMEEPLAMIARRLHQNMQASHLGSALPFILVRAVIQEKVSLLLVFLYNNYTLPLR